MSRHSVRVFAPLLGLVLFGACGGSGSGPTAATAPPAPVTVVLAQGSVASFAPNTALFLDPITTTRVGRLEVTADWTAAGGNVDVYITQGACTFEEINNLRCNFIGIKQTAEKPERLQVANVAAGTYQVILVNRGVAPETVTWQVTLAG